jgi:methionine-rich copper-binding protein CopC
MTTGVARARALAACVLGLAVLVGLPPTASAHSELVSSTPEAGSTVAQAPDSVVLQFSEAVQQQGSSIVVTAGNDQVVSQAGTFTVDGTSASVALGAADVSGGVTVAYRIVSADGHVVRDGFTFDVTSSGAGPTDAGPQSPASSPLAQQQPDDSGGSVVWVLGLGAIGLVLVAAVIAVAVRGRRGRSD